MPFPRAAGLRTSTYTEALKKPIFLLLLLLSMATAVTHAADADSAVKYQQAVSEKQTSRRILAFEEFISANPGDPLRADAMELLVWNYKQIGNQQKASS